MKRILLPLLVLLAVVGVYAYYRLDLYSFTPKDLSVISSADKVALQLVEEKRIKSATILSSFQEFVDKNKNNTSLTNTFQRAKQVQILTSDLLEKGQNIRMLWLTSPEINANEFLIEFAKSSQEFVSKLRSVAESKQLSNVLISPLTNEVISAEEFVNFFTDTPLEIRLYALTAMQASIANREQEAMLAIINKTDFPLFKINDLAVVVEPRRLVFTEGESYDAQLKIVSISDNLQSQFEIDNAKTLEAVKVTNQASFATVSFVAQADNFDERGIAVKEWTGKMTVKLPSGKDSTFLVREKYIVRKKRDGSSNQPTPTEINPNENRE